jgi:hypothetical protein
VSADTTQIVAAILDAPPSPEDRDLPPAIQELRRIRSAARRIIEDGLDDVLLRALARHASRARLALWALDTILAELRAPAPPPAVKHDQAQGRLRRAGFERCPICLTRVMPSLALEAAARRRRWAEQDAALWRDAV